MSHAMNRIVAVVLIGLLMLLGWLLTFTWALPIWFIVGFFLVSRFVRYLDAHTRRL